MSTTRTVPTTALPARPAAVPEPTSAPPAVTTGVVIAVVVLALGVLGIWEALVGFGWVSGSSWLAGLLGGLDGGVARGVPVLVAGVVVGLLGLWVLLRSFRGRSATGISLGDGTNAWLAPEDVARIADVAASDVDGVVTVRSRAARRSVKLKVTALDTAGNAKSEVRDAVTAALAGLDPTPRVSVSVSTLGGTR